MRIEQGERGFSRISAEDPATHDDVSDALSLGMVPFLPPRGKRVRCLLPKLANNFPEEATLQGLAEPVVQTGGGLRVYQRPVLQSVCGLDVSLPADVRRVRQQSDDTARRVRRAYLAAVAEAAESNGE